MICLPTDAILSLIERDKEESGGETVSDTGAMTMGLIWGAI